MEYHVPQFIEIEDKIVGPLTLKQFIYIAGTGGICIVAFAYLPMIFALLVSIPVIALGVMLSFYKINGKPFIEILEAGFNYYTGAKLFLWKHQEPTAEKRRLDAQAATEKSKAEAIASAPRISRLTQGKLSELAWSLDVKKGGGSEELES